MKYIFLFSLAWDVFSCSKKTNMDVISVSERQILVNENPYLIKGICYHPVPKGSKDLSFNSLDQDLALMVEAGINTIRVYVPIDNKDVLDKIHEEDQKYRRQIDAIEKEFGWKSDEMQAHWQIIHEKDSLNLIQIEKILKERGWLGSHIIGEQGNGTLFLVIQHAGIETQLQYLPMMREAVKLGNARASSLALLEDRVALRQGKRQIYGSQIHSDKTGEKFVAPLIDPENVDKRRSEVGLGPLAEYIKHWDLTWDLAKHKERAVKIESEQEK